MWLAVFTIKPKTSTESVTIVAVLRNFSYLMNVQAFRFGAHVVTS
jgi:hypothetical protein